MVIQKNSLRIFSGFFLGIGLLALTGGLFGSSYVRGYEQKNANLITYVVTGIDLKTTGATTIFTTDSGGDRFHPLFTIIEVTAQSGLAVGSTYSIGTNASSYNNILASAVSGITSNKMLPTAMSALTDSIAPETAVKINISVAATGTSGSCSVSVIGFYR